MPAEEEPDYEAREALMDSIKRDNTLFTEKTYRVGFPKALRIFSRATSIEASGEYKVGLVATETGAHNYIHVACKTSPPDRVEEVSGWRKIDEKSFWTWTPDPLDVSSSFPGDLEPIEVCFEASDQIELEAMVGRCVTMTKDSSGGRAWLTQGLVIQAEGTKWAINVGHGFSNEGSTHPKNSVQFCALVPEGSPNGQECNACQQNKCNSVCETVNRVTVATGVTDILTFNPKPDKSDMNWIDFGVHKVPYNPAIRLTVLVVSDVFKINLKEQLQNKDLQAYKELAGPQDGIIAVGGDIYSYQLAELLMMMRPKGVFLFGRGKRTGWSFAKLSSITDTLIRAKYIGKTTQPGDCGAIWWIIDAERHMAFPLGYHQGRSKDPGGDVALIVPYLTAINRLVSVDTRFENYQFLSGDSYVWGLSPTI